MFATLISFFGGSVFRMLWGEISSFMNKKQDYACLLYTSDAADE